MPGPENPLADRIPLLSQDIERDRNTVESLPGQISAMQARLAAAEMGGKKAGADLREFTGIPIGDIPHGIIKSKIPDWPGGDNAAQLVEVSKINSNITFFEARP